MSDLAYFLKAAETDMAKQNAYLEVDLAKFAAGGTGQFTPATVTDVLKAVVPHISTLIGIIKRNYNMYPTYLITGLKSASLLRSLQEMMVSLASQKGELGWSGAGSQFLKLRILECPAIDDDRMYMSIKAPQNALEKSAIVDLVYQPLYVVKEITDGLTRHFVRSRTMIEVTRTDGLGVIVLKNYQDFIG